MFECPTIKTWDIAEYSYFFASILIFVAQQILSILPRNGMVHFGAKLKTYNNLIQTFFFIMSNFAGNKEGEQFQF